jgi:hypothetical protein
MLIDCVIDCIVFLSCDCNLYINTSLREEYTENIHSNNSTNAK